LYAIDPVSPPVSQEQVLEISPEILSSDDLYETRETTETDLGNTSDDGWLYLRNTTIDSSYNLFESGIGEAIMSPGLSEEDEEEDVLAVGFEAREEPLGTPLDDSS
jgi:hypothetical protein